MICLFFIERIYLLVVLVLYRYNVKVKVYLYIDDWNCVNVLEDILCSEVFSIRVWEGFSGWSIFGWCIYDLIIYFKMNLLVFFIFRNVKIRGKEILLFVM